MRQSIQQQRNAQRRQEKFYAWLGEVLSTGMTQEQFDSARFMFEKGISTKAMKTELDKPANRRKKS